MTDSAPAKTDAPAKKTKIAPVAIIGLVLLAITTAVFVVLWILPRDALSRLRDISIVMLAILVFFALLLSIFMLAIIVWGLDRLSRRLDDLLQRSGAVVDQVKGTATTVKGTADFVGERIASPFIRVSAWATGIGKGIATLWRGQKEEQGGTE